MKKYDEKTGDVLELVDFVVALAVAVEKATADGTQWYDVLALLPPMTKFPSAIEGIENVPEQLKNLNDEQRLEISIKLKELGFADVSAAEIGQQALRSAVEFARLFYLIRDERKSGRL